jgi:HlyD family secretion protein
MNKKNGKKKLVWWIAGGSVLLIIVIIILFVAFGKDSRPVVEAGKVEQMDKLTALVTASGEIKPKVYVNLQSEIAGVITDLYVKEGDPVTKGDLLLKIDPIQTEADTRAAEFQLRSTEEDARNTQREIETAGMNVRITKANLASAVADLEQAKANLEMDTESFKRKQSLHEENLISKEEYDMARAQFKVAQTRVDAAQARIDELKTRIEVSQVNIKQMEDGYRSAQARVEQFKAMVTRARDLLSKTVLTSPITGVITSLVVEKGERAVPGTLNNPAATLMTIADLSIIEAEVKVDETDIIHVKLNQPVAVKVDALPDQTLKAHVTEIGNSAIIQPGQQQVVGGSDQAKDFKVVAQLDKPPVTLRPGLSATAEITTAVKTDVLAVPLQALVMREVELGPLGNVVHDWQKDAKTKAADAKKKPKLVEKQGVFVLTKDNRAVFTLVETGITGETNIEVLKGLQKDEEIVTGSFKTLRTLKDGEFVTKKRAAVQGPGAKAEE